MRTKLAFPTIFSVSLAMLFLVSTSLTLFPSASAQSSTLVLNSSTCTVNFFGTWDSTTSTCTVTSASLGAGLTLKNPSGTTLLVNNAGLSGFSSDGIVINLGKIVISNSGG
jgi:hypothetical protein